MDAARSAFLNDIAKELEEENISIFAGAGMSIPAGFVNWKDLLRPIAEEIGLDVEEESDLVALAQYHCNENSGNRSQLTKRLIEEFSKSTEITDNHRILCRLPIRTYWSTNYDKLIENALLETGKVVDVKYTNKHLAFTKPRRDAVVYKMHGDIDHPDDTVLTKDDYEKYSILKEPYIAALRGDLVSKTMIFIGFSFSDPNLDYVLSRIRVAFGINQRRHYTFLRNVQKNGSESDAEYEYRKRKQKLFIQDLGRFNIKTILVNEYYEITEMLREIERRYLMKTVFISGAACEYGSWTEKEVHDFLHRVSSKMVDRGFRIVSGFGLGIGSSIISGALEKIYMNPQNRINDQLILRPFPQMGSGKIPLPELWTKYRSDMISHAGIAVFLFGNKKKGNETVISNGMLEEYKICVSKGLAIIPVGATGFASEEIYKLNMTENHQKTELRKLKERLNQSDITLEEIEKFLLEAIEEACKGG